MRSWILSLALLLAACASIDGAKNVVSVTERAGARGPKVLAVVAHPDDETAFAATLYKLTTHLDASCDVLVITNGEGGFKYSTLAERIYGAELTEEAIGRARLPEIRQREMVEGARILGVRRLHFLAQRDHRYTTDLSEVLGPKAAAWDLGFVRRELAKTLAKEKYDYVLALRPTRGTHAHHQAATRLAREAVLAVPADRRPLLLVAEVTAAQDEGPREADPEIPPSRYAFDRTQKFGYQDKLDYRIVVDWEIAAHKSQGTMQLAMRQGEREEFALWGDEGPVGEERARELFRRLAEPQFARKSYGPSAGTNVESTP